MKTNTIRGTYGSAFTPCNVFTAETRSGTWYAVEGSCNVNFTPDEITEPVDAESLSDTDAFTWPAGVNSEEELETAIEA